MKLLNRKQSTTSLKNKLWIYRVWENGEGKRIENWVAKIESYRLAINERKRIARS